MIYFGDLEKFDMFLNERFGKTIVGRLYADGVRAGEMTISMAYYPDLNFYGGRESVQMIMQYYC